MNKILVTVGYNAKFVLPDDADSGLVIAALSRATLVDSHGYGKDEKFTPQENAEFSVRRIAASAVVVDAEDVASVKLEETKRSLESTQKAWMASREKVAELERKIAEAAGT